MARRRFRTYRKKRRRRARSNGAMSKPQKKALAIGVLGTIAVLVFQPTIYQMIATKLGRA